MVTGEAVKRSKTNDSVLIVIVRSGSGETSPELKRRRLYNVGKYFQARGALLPSENLVIASGEPVIGHGRVEYYLDGKLYQKLLYPSNDYICHSCYGPDAEYYPDKARAGRRK